MVKNKTIYGGRWAKPESMGGGGQGDIFFVSDLSDTNQDKKYVLKRLRHQSRINRFAREVSILKTLNSPYIPEIVDHALGSIAYVVMPYLGKNLESHLTYRSLSLNQKLQLFEQIVSAVFEAHTNDIIHRDIKPNNIVLSDDCSTAYLIDFGLGKSFNDIKTITESDEAFGNAAFAAPECSRGRSEEPSFASDIYSLGKLLYWMVSGGKFINREDLSDDVLLRMKTSDQHLIYYISRIFRETIIENPSKRWNVQKLLEVVATTKTLIARYESWSLRGKRVIHDNFGIGDTFNPYSSRSTTMPAQGNPPSDADLAVRFTLPKGEILLLDSIELALQLKNGASELDVWLVESREATFGDPLILESFKSVNQVTITANVVTLISVINPILEPDKNYWIVLSTPNPDSNIALLSAPEEFVPRHATFAERHDDHEWEIKISLTGPGYAFRVIGRLKD